MLIKHLSVPLLLTGSLVLGAAGMAKAVGADQEKLERTAKDVEKLKSQRTEDALDVRELKTELKDIAHGVERIESRLGSK